MKLTEIPWKYVRISQKNWTDFEMCSSNNSRFFWRNM